MPWIKSITLLQDTQESHRETLKKVVSTVLRNISSKEELQSVLKTELPLLYSTGPDRAPCLLSFYLVSVSRQDAFKFFFELVTRFLVPEKKLTAVLLFAADFHFEGISDELFTAAELVVTIDNDADLLAISAQRPVIEGQIRLGISSAYHALRILEMKELLQDERTLLLHDRISALARRKRFDIYLIAEMQQFLATTSEAFRSKRKLHHLNRLICLLYVFKKTLRERREETPAARHCFIKVMRSHVKSDDVTTPVVSVLVALNLISEQEVFEESNLVKSVDTICPHLKLKRSSFFSSFTGQSDLKVLYAEFVKPADETVSHDEVKRLRKLLPETVVSQVEELLHPIFMPHNEEEIIRNIVTLAKQLRFVRDIPQVIITFNDHTGSELSFTVILLRLLKKDDQSLEKLFASSSAVFIKERVKVVGFVRKIHPKEANVFQLRIKKKPFIRQDRSIDLYKARQAILEELHAAMGLIRDYNGGMLSKHREVFASVKKELGTLPADQEFLLENFFYGITPVIMKNLLDPRILKSWFVFFAKAIAEESTDLLHELEEESYLFIAVTSRRLERLRSVYENLVQANLHTTQFAAILLKHKSLYCLSLLSRSPHKEERAQWRENVIHLLGTDYK